MLHTYGITEGVIAIDETDNPRSKKTPFIGFAHKYFEKKSGGYKNGQEIILELYYLSILYALLWRLGL